MARISPSLITRMLLEVEFAQTGRYRVCIVSQDHGRHLFVLKRWKVNYPDMVHIFMEFSAHSSLLVDHHGHCFLSVVVLGLEYRLDSVKTDVRSVLEPKSEFLSNPLPIFLILADEGHEVLLRLRLPIC